jgi:DtxR family transcriptional regulator, Mn-dependent transcriptional regulator
VRADPNVVTETLELLLDRAERDEPTTRAQLDTALRADPGASDAAVDHLLAEGSVVEADTGALQLTAEGHSRAVVAVRRHRLTERLLADVIGLDWWKVHHEAERWEGVISDEVEKRLVEVLDDPGTCPHGNPIPGSSNRPSHPDVVRLDRAPEGPVHVVRITEELERDDAALQLLERCGFLPGRDAELKVIGTDGVEVAGTVTDATLPAHVAAHTYVAPR